MDDRFVADHKPGALVPTASAAPTLFVPRERLPAWMPSAYAYALHLRGEVPFPELDTAIFAVAGGLNVRAVQRSKMSSGCRYCASDRRREAPSIPAVCWLDDLIAPDVAIEYKSLTERTFTDDWSDGPPDHVLGQVHTQMTIDPALSRVIVVPIIFGFAAIRVERFEIARDPGVCDLIPDTVAAFVTMLRRGETPEFTGDETSYRAWSQHYAPTEATLDLSADPEARWRGAEWHQARLDRSAIDAACEAHKWFFARMLGRAGGYSRIRVATLPEDIKLSRTERKAYSVAASTALSWRFVRREK